MAGQAYSSSKMSLISFILVNLLVIVINAHEHHFIDAKESLFDQVLDSEACEEQMAYILSNENTLLKYKFMDASMRIPRGIMMTNLRDMGSYYQCLDINHEELNMVVQGKYCVIQIPLQQDITMPVFGSQFPWVEQPADELQGMKSWSDNDTYHVMKQYQQGKESLENVLGTGRFKTQMFNESLLGSVQIELAICIPKVCTSHQALNILTTSVASNFDYKEAFCRLPNDKPWTVGDYVAISIFSLIGVLTLLSTFYDIRNTVLERDPKKVNRLYTSFSVYSNTNKLLTFSNNPNNLHCLDGIRSIAMLWIIIGHTFSTQLIVLPMNPIDVFEFMTSFKSLWITSGTINVDTFFMMSGLLLVYTTAHKMTSISLLKNLHLFYLNRILRMFPVLATAVLLQASLLNHMTDGPYWGIVTKSVSDCQQYWWTTLLYVHNLVSFGYLCIGHSWYLAIDMQLYIISPIVLFWVLSGSKRSAWAALVGSFLAVVAGATVYNFIMEFQSAAISFNRPEDTDYYTKNYYINTLPRASPFFVGMIFGYVLHLFRGKRVRLSKVTATLLWLIATVATTTIIVAHYFIIQPDWDNQTVDSILNSFMRPAWAAGVAWLVFACTHGYGGPINWFLSLHMFKFLGRISYAMYIIHLPLIYLINSTALAPTYFSVEFSIYSFMIQLNFTIIASVLITVLIDLPFAGLIGMLMTGAQKGKQKSNDTS